MRWYILYCIIRMFCVIYEVVYFVWYHTYVLCDLWGGIFCIVSYVCFVWFMRWYILYCIIRMFCVIYEVVYFVWYHTYVLCDLWGGLFCMVSYVCFVWFMRWYILYCIIRMFCVIVSGGIFCMVSCVCFVWLFQVVHFVWYHTYVLCDCFRRYCLHHQSARNCDRRHFNSSALSGCHHLLQVWKTFRHHQGEISWFIENLRVFWQLHIELLCFFRNWYFDHFLQKWVLGDLPRK